VSWYLRSTSDHDTHRADRLRRDGTVAAACGVEFRPHPLLHGAVALRGSPPDPDQICPECYRAPDAL